LAIGIETGLRSRSRQPLALYNRMTFYTGLFAADDSVRCGAWSEAALAMALEDLDQPLAAVARRRLADKWPELPAILRCKVRTYVGYTEIASQWIIPPATWTPGVKVRRPLGRLIHTAELRGAKALKLLLVIGFVAALVRPRGRRRRAVPIAITLTIVLGYVAQHAIVEIQARYLLEPLVFGVAAVWLAFPWTAGRDDGA
jgi:hypothetical protein